MKTKRNEADGSKRLKYDENGWLLHFQMYNSSECVTTSNTHDRPDQSYNPWTLI